MSSPPRTALFISHATPESNAFTLWLGAKLTALGYEVFADILRLKGGNDWERILEDAIRHKAGKFLLVATPVAMEKQGVRNEIRIASETGKKIGDTDFIIPLRVEPYEATLGTAHAQWVDFSESWQKGLADLLAQLGEIESIKPTTDAGNADIWRSIQLKDARSVGRGAEKLQSNWLAVESLPEVIRFYDFRSGINIGKAEAAKQAATIPLVAHNRGFVSFSPLDELQDYFGPDLPLKISEEIPTEDFLEQGAESISLKAGDARRKFADLTRRALDRYFESKGLLPFKMANGHLAWWPPASESLKTMISFAWPNGPSGRRLIVGQSEKRAFHWHFGVSCAIRNQPVRHIRVTPRVIFTRDGREIYGDANRLHRLRRSFCKMWRNDKWRDLLLAFLWWISNGANFIDVPMAEGTNMRLKLPPISFDAPFGVDSADDSIPSDDTEDDDDVSDGETFDDADDPSDGGGE